MLQSDFTPSALDESELLGIQTLSDPVMSTAQSFSELSLRFFLNLLSCWVIVKLLYYPKSRSKEYVFTFLAFSSAMLLLLYAMSRVDVGVGLTLGLFAIFGVIRYRTETVPIREMTYLFVIIALAAVNGLTPLFRIVGIAENTAHYALGAGDLLVAVSANALAIVLIWILEGSRSLRKSASKIILYDRVELIVPGRRDELFKDIEERCGIKPLDISVGNIDFLKDSAYIKVYYNSDSTSDAGLRSIVRNKQFIENQNL